MVLKKKKSFVTFLPYDFPIMDRVLLTFIMISIYKPLLYNSPLYFLTRSRQLQLEQYRMQLYIGHTG